MQRFVMVDETEPEPVAVNGVDAGAPGRAERPAVFIERQDAKRMRAAGFSEEEVRYMLDLPERPEPTT